MTTVDIASRPLSEADHARQLRRAVIASTVGTTIEWYDFLLYSIVTGLVFGKLFFPNQDPLSATLLAFGTYFVGFAARPVGGLGFEERRPLDDEMSDGPVDAHRGVSLQLGDAAPPGDRPRQRARRGERGGKHDENEQTARHGRGFLAMRIAYCVIGLRLSASTAAGRGAGGRCRRLLLHDVRRRPSRSSRPRRRPSAPGSA